MTTITVTATPAVILRHAIELSKKRDGEDTFDRQARTLNELGYAIVPTGTEACTGPVAVELPGPDDTTVVDDDSGATAGLPTWLLRSGMVTADAVLAWPDGVDFDGDLTEGEDALRTLEQDALKVLAAVRASRRAARIGARRDAGVDEARRG